MDVVCGGDNGTASDCLRSFPSGIRTFMFSSNSTRSCRLRGSCAPTSVGYRASHPAGTIKCSFGHWSAFTNDDDEGAAISGVTLAIEAISQLSDAQLKEDRKQTLKKGEANVKERDNFLRMPKCWESPSTSSVSESGKKHQESCGSVVYSRRIQS
ncbi:hypothetical protein KIN20_022603 [Parelaphostrongylus tenuis]|uniref:Uncharacterized protein n=1 Tax=Parelaphostrongylus tenuis TaxID=148309 RepID=A0AAD5QUX7_PARTN|nr:hypothetical protein KIN20_022603 [Parelaphostrongylus tenuis]